MVPLVLCGALSALLALGLGRDPREIPSPLLDRPAPDFRVPLLHEPQRMFASEDTRGSAYVLNVWASWCVACRAEHDVLLALSRASGLPVFGLNYKDEAAPALAFLETYGNPYTATLQDITGDVGMDYGVYGVPETFIVDRAGIIRYKHIGALTQEAVDRDLLPLARRMQ